MDSGSLALLSPARLSQQAALSAFPPLIATPPKPPSLSSQDTALSTLATWLADSACNRNPGVLLMAGIIYNCEGNYVEALKACHSGLTLEMMALCVQVRGGSYTVT